MFYEDRQCDCGACNLHYHVSDNVRLKMVRGYFLHTSIPSNTKPSTSMQPITHRLLFEVGLTHVLLASKTLNQSTPCYFTLINHKPIKDQVHCVWMDARYAHLQEFTTFPLTYYHHNMAGAFSSHTITLNLPTGPKLQMESQMHAKKNQHNNGAAPNVFVLPSFTNK